MTLLTERMLNRATLARQLLLAREELTPLRAVERLLGLQAQQARPPFLGLWSRLEAFRRADLIALFQARSLVRATFLRGTLHVLSARDFVALRPAVQPMLTRAMHSILKERIKDLELSRVVATSDRSALRCE